MSQARLKTISFSPGRGELISLGRWIGYMQAKGYKIIRIKGKKQYEYNFNLNDEQLSDEALLAFGQDIYDHLSSESIIAFMLGEDDICFLEIEKEALLNRLYRWFRNRRNKTR